MKYPGLHVPTDPHLLLALAAAAVFGLLVWGLMHWAEKRWNRDTPKNRRLPRR